MARNEFLATPFFRRMDYLILTLAGFSLAAAAFFSGGVTEFEWGLCAAGIGLACGLYWSTTPKYKRAPAESGLPMVAGALVLWTVLQIVPLPSAVIRILSPHKQIAGGAFSTLSEAPGAGFVYVVTVAAILSLLLLAREFGWRFRRNLHFAFVPIVAIGTLEAVLGLAQFLMMREGGAAASATGTYPNRNHYAGLLEIILPVAVAGAVDGWKRTENARTYLFGSILLFVPALLLIAVVVSLSRMGFVASLTGLLVLWLLTLGRRWRMAGMVLFTAGFVALPTAEWVLRFGDFTPDIASDSRAQIWRETLPLIGDYWLCGTGMGGFANAFYRYKHVAPMYTVDYVHNDYLQLLAELGAVGFTVGLVLFAVVVTRLRRRVGASWAANAACASLAAMLIHSLVDFNMYIPANAAALAWIVGVALAPEDTSAEQT